jgi:hypothetical protein
VGESRSKCCIGSVFVFCGLLIIALELCGSADMVGKETLRILLLILSGTALVTFGVWMGWSEWLGKLRMKRLA